jgi:hypothetical protein
LIDFMEALGRVADAKSIPTASDLDAAGYPTVLEWALDKERLEGSGGVGSSSSSSGGPAATSAGGETNDNNALSSSLSGAAEKVGSTSGAAVGPGAASGTLPDIFRPRPSARFGAPKPRPLYAKLEMLLELLMRRLFWDPAQPESVFSVDGLMKIIKKIDKDLGP